MHRTRVERRPCRRLSMMGRTWDTDCRTATVRVLVVSLEHLERGRCLVWRPIDAVNGMVVAQLRTDVTL